MKVRMKLKLGKGKARKMPFQGHIISDLEWAEIELNDKQAELLKTVGITYWFDVEAIEDKPKETVKKKRVRKKVTKKK